MIKSDGVTNWIEKILKRITLCTQVQHATLQHRPRMPANKTGQTELLIFFMFFLYPKITTCFHYHAYLTNILPGAIYIAALNF